MKTPFVAIFALLLSGAALAQDAQEGARETETYIAHTKGTLDGLFKLCEIYTPQQLARMRHAEMEHTNLETLTRQEYDASFVQGQKKAQKDWDASTADEREIACDLVRALRDIRVRQGRLQAPEPTSP